MVRGKIVSQDVNHDQEFKEWCRAGIEEWLKDHPQEYGVDTYYIVTLKKSRKQGYNCSVELVGRTNLWMSKYFDEDAYRAFARCMRDLFPISENASYVAEQAWA
ncbi:MAG: hypothetical protein ABL958_12640 [Bdellovibrionia bacterium]